MINDKIQSKIFIYLLIFCTAVTGSFGCTNNNKSSKENNTVVATTLPKEENKKKFDILTYTNGLWASENLQSNTYILEITPFEDNTVSLYLRYFEHGDLGHTAEIYDIFDIKEFLDNKFVFNFRYDGYGHTGSVELTFNNDNIAVKIFNIKGASSSDAWGFVEDSFILKNNPSAYESLPSEPVNDLSKASGILEGLGMTENEFIENCSYISHRDIIYQYNSATDSVNTFNPEYTYKQIREYPANYLGLYCYDDNLYVSSKGQSKDGYTTYEVKDKASYEGNVILFDKRDDVYSPTISVEDSITAYMIFKGVQTLNGIDYDCFDLISVKK